MKIINETTVVLTERESYVQSQFEKWLDRGMNIPNAAQRAKDVFAGMDPAFYRWLEDKPLLPLQEPISVGLSKWCIARLKDSRESGEVEESVSDEVIEREAAKLETLIFQLASSFVDNEFVETP